MDAYGNFIEQINGLLEPLDFKYDDFNKCWKYNPNKNIAIDININDIRVEEKFILYKNGIMVTERANMKIVKNMLRKEKIKNVLNSGYMNRLEEFRKRYHELVGDEDINFGKVLVYSRYDFLNHRIVYKNIKYYNIQVIIKYILNLDDYQLEFIKNICSNNDELYGDEKILYKNIIDYLNNVTVGKMLDEYIAIERKRKIKEVIG